MGEVPDWYPLVQQAKWLGIPPWELAEAPLLWQQWVGIAMAAEYEASETKRKHAQ